MSDPDTPGPAPQRAASAPAEQAVTPRRPITPLKSSLTAVPAVDDKTLCERCGADMYRMHAVWRCSACGFKTDCCGW